MNENLEKRRATSWSGSSGVLLLIVGGLVMAMFAYTYYVSVQGIANESVYFNLVELVPLIVMVISYWICAFFKKRR